MASPDPTGCWLWGGSYFPNGYGQVWSPALQRPTQAHRLVYEFFGEPIPEGLTIDHVCRVRACVNPHHLQVVTQKENIHAPGARCVAKANAAKQVCPEGHPYDAENTYTRNSKRYCRTCKREAKRRARSARPANRLTHTSERT